MEERERERESKRSREERRRQRRGARAWSSGSSDGQSTRSNSSRARIHLAEIHALPHLLLFFSSLSQLSVGGCNLFPWAPQEVYGDGEG